ncbi:c-type cytochrome [Jiella avicenniae]|uniref:C-type cytochrome n=1 Tax=Jiella avicenniae TaxID=2907202 RepID=A0A9X1P1H6_9HYPH|nr:c-type cytochrome [Jiella avicenniae]MCE7028625.1 c-type cytochrome [Jiella avicenniae]
MTTKMTALAGALVLSVSGLAFAQNSGTTIVPQGQSMPGQTSGGAAAAAATSGGQAASQAPAEGSGGAAAQASGGGQAAGGGTSQPDGNGEAAAAGGEAPTTPVSGDAKMADAEHMKPDAHPSKDTATEGNEPTEGDLGKYTDPSGNPTYLVDADGKADWYTWRGYKKYMANCMQCHGPDGLGSSFAPNLTDQLQALSYYDFAGIVVSGQQNKWNPSGNSVMPAWGEDPNVMCSMDAIYIYLRARADGVVGRGEPKRIGNNKAAQDEEYSCLGF